MTTNKTTKLLNEFLKGKVLTVAQIRSKFGVRNVSAHISYIRQNHDNRIITSRKGNKTYYGLQAAA
jgi:hypothetical protein